MLDELRGLASDGVGKAQEVFELLTTPSTEITDKRELNGEIDFVDSPVTSIRLRLVEDSYEIEIKGLDRHPADESHARYPINRLVRETRLRNEPVNIVIAGNLNHIHSVFAVFTLLKHKVDTYGMSNVRIDMGIADTTYYVSNNEECVRCLKRWFHRSRQNIPCLAHLIQSAAHNDFGEFSIKRGKAYLLPTSEELLLFYLRMRSRRWNAAFLDILASLGTRRKRAQRDYLALAKTMAWLIPKGWRDAIDAHSDFIDFMQRERSGYSAALNMLQPINLLTDKLLARATLILTTTQNCRTALLQRFPAGVEGKVVFFADMSRGQCLTNCTKLESPYTPPTFFSSAKWNASKEEAIERQLLEHLIPGLRQEIRTEK